MAELLETLIPQVAAGNERIDNLEDALALLKSERENSARLMTGLKDLRKARELTSSVLESDRKRLELVAQELSDQAAEVKRLKEENASLLDRSRRLEMDSSTGRSRISALERENTDLKEQRAALEKSRVAGDKAVREAQSQVEFYREQCDELRYALNQIEPLVHSLQKDLDGWKRGQTSMGLVVPKETTSHTNSTAGGSPAISGIPAAKSNGNGTTHSNGKSQVTSSTVPKPTSTTPERPAQVQPPVQSAPETIAAPVPVVTKAEPSVEKIEPVAITAPQPVQESVIAPPVEQNVVVPQVATPVLESELSDQQAAAQLNESVYLPCPSCEALNPRSAQFCGHCGGGLASKRPDLGTKPGQFFSKLLKFKKSS